MAPTKKRIAILFHKTPFVSANGIDQVRLRAISSGLVKLGFETEIVAPVLSEGLLENGIAVRPVSVLSENGRYDLVKTSYHGSLKYLDSFDGPVVSRIVRVIDEELPERDEANRSELIHFQEIIRDRSDVVVVNNEENRQRWIGRYGHGLPVELVPTGCPEVIPSPGANPFRNSGKNILFIGSIAAPRMLHMLNHAARRLEHSADIHLIGLNKVCMYGGDDSCLLDSRIIDHGEKPEDELWNYIFHADLGLAFATGLHAFDNDVSKILNYLRGGLPVVSESPIINNELIRKTDFGIIFDHGDVDHMVDACERVMNGPFRRIKESVMSLMAREHSWLRRSQVYAEIFDRLL